MTAPDPGLTDLIAAHRLKQSYWNWWGCTGCDWRTKGTYGSEPTTETATEHAKHVVEQHTKGRIASDLGADPQDYEIAWAAKLRWQARAEKAEAAVDRVRAVEAEYLDPEDTDIECREDVWRFTRDLRAALEGEQQ